MYIVYIQYVVFEMIINDEYDILNAPVQIVPIYDNMHIFQTILIMIW